VTGDIKDALSTKGVRSRLFRLADSNLGYYDPNHENKAIYYQESTLMVHVLFESRERALQFESQLRAEKVTMGSSLNNMEITSNVSSLFLKLFDLQRIYFDHYKPTDSESPQDTFSQISTEFSYFGNTSDEFKYQRIEADWVFGSLGNAESAHLMSREHCKKYESYHKYDNDKSNRLALSRDMHGFYDALSSTVPVINITIHSISTELILDGRYRVDLNVAVISAEYKEIIFNRLKTGSTRTDDELVMQTFVYILDPNVFNKCILWKASQIEKR